MYARFIPGQTPAQRQDDAPVTRTSTTATDVASVGFGYSRYIPGATSQQSTQQAQNELPKIQHFDDEPSPPTPKRKRVHQEELDESSKKPKKDKKSKKETKNASGDEDAQTNDTAVKAKNGKKDKGSKTRKDSPDTLDNTNGVSEVNGSKSDEESLKEKKKKKKSKSKSKSKRAIEDQEADESQDGRDVEMADIDENLATNDEPVSQEPEPDKRRKKENKEKKKKEATIEQEEATEEEDQRHKAVLERKLKSLKFAEATRDKKASNDEAEESFQPHEAHGLEPLPQPEPAPQSTEKPTYDTLPSWLSAPIRVSTETCTPFTELGIPPKAARFLDDKGFAQAFAVQTAAVPLLLPTSKEQPGDILISAATGSGKTLAYALPITRDISSSSVVTRLRALVVLPTRELVKQAQEAFEICARAFEEKKGKRVRTGVSVGSQSLSSEQESLICSESRYDPETYKLLLERQTNNDPLEDGFKSEAVTVPGSLANATRLGRWEGQVEDLHSKVDVLICTPGRLVEHMEQTPGFTLDYVRWLVVDEADKLLSQSFQGWLDLVLENFKTSRFGARDFHNMAYSGVRKIILSATLTRDLSLLNQLALRRPRLIVLDSDGDATVAEHSLPGELREFAIRVHDANLKPLYLLDLLRGPHMTEAAGTEDSKPALDAADAADAAASDTSSDTSSDSDSDSDSSSDSDTSSDSDSDSDSGSDSKKEEEEKKNKTLPMSLIFTKSNESALRLSRLLALLDPSLAAHTATLTSNTPTSARRKTLNAFAAPASALRLVIASDLVARGIDIPRLAHVINYDLPPSVAGYVHRVGRTARAGRPGCAWTLVGDAESGWFWGKIAKGAGVKRARKVDRARVEEMGEDKVAEYEDALARLGKEVLEPSRRWHR
ncbi:ATP-dependent RNA helicase dbp6 [Escovopsis weberi]|uniref:ATP-dependent RNA helicase n=1 Tax=Escovopsis weberi TaxID=150374 RepID=A0A0M9VWY5_ESCWE|nr:ATP-dependent RNA helicase dbp6 [Escovopsis weberi]